jgi:hypothetical protein
LRGKALRNFRAERRPVRVKKIKQNNILAPGSAQTDRNGLQRAGKLAIALASRVQDDPELCSGQPKSFPEIKIRGFPHRFAFDIARAGKRAEAYPVVPGMSKCGILG